MKFLRTVSVLFLSMVLSCPAAFSWGGTGHAAVAQVAEFHLNKKAKKALKKILDGRTLHEVASDADHYRSVWLRDMGKEIVNPSDFRLKGWRDFDYNMPSNIEPWTHSFCINDEKGECFHTDILVLDGKNVGINNCVLYIDRFSKEILSGKEMPEDSLMIKVCLMVHWLGDMHCPMHIQYYPNDMSKGGTMYYMGEKYSLHSFWDGKIFSLAFKGLDYYDIAGEADSFENADFKAVTAGDIWDWGPACAKQAREGRLVDGVRISSKVKVPDNFPQTARAVALRQIRDGGWRLAALFNQLFGGE